MVYLREWKRIFNYGGSLIIMMMLLLPVVKSDEFSIASTNTPTGYINGVTGCSDSGDYTYNNREFVNVGNVGTGSGYERQGFITFDTSSIDDDATVEAAYINYWFDYESLENGEYVYIFDCDYGATLEVADWNTALGDSNGIIGQNGMSTNTWYDINVSLDHIDLTGDTQYCLVMNRTCVDTSDYIRVGDSGAADRILLNITYSSGGSPPSNCWTEESGKLIVPPGCKYYTSIKEEVAP